MSAGVDRSAMPSDVFIVRSASGVTTISDRAVGGPSDAGATVKSTPTARMSWTYTAPSWSSRTLPMNAARPPSEATPTVVFAAEPPDASMPGGIAAYSASARSGSTSCIESFVSPCSTRNASSTSAITSTMALPTASTS